MCFIALRLCLFVIFEPQNSISQMLGYASPHGVGIVEFWIAVFLRHKSTPLANGNVNPSLQSLHVSGGSSSLFRSHIRNPF